MAATDELITAVVSIATAIVGVALVSVIVSKNANTSGVLSAAGSAFSMDLGTAVSPVTGGGVGSSGFQLPSFTGLGGYA